MLMQRNISVRQVKTNRANARRSTGPKSARKGAQSKKLSPARAHFVRSSVWGRRSADKPEVRRLWERHRNELDSEDDNEVASLIEKVATEWAHRLRAVELEKNLSKSAVHDGSVGIRLRSLNRYRATNQRALLRLLKRLR
jgi:hypothetical protein